MMIPRTWAKWIVIVGIAVSSDLMVSYFSLQGSRSLWPTTTVSTASSYVRKTETVNNQLMQQLHDKTISWSSNVTRLWLGTRSNSKRRPPAQLLLTTYGWNHPDQQSIGLSFSRSIRSRDLVTGAINHPWFHPTAWEDYESGRQPMEPNIRYYVFLDVDTCVEVSFELGCMV